MRYKLFCLILLFGAIAEYAYSQINTVAFIWDTILNKLNIPNELYYQNFEMAISSEVKSISIEKCNNAYNDNLIDYKYFLYFDSYRIILYKSASNDKYFITGIEMDLNKNYDIKLLLTHKTMEQFKLDKIFGQDMEIFSTNDKLVYETDEGWGYFTFCFLNNIVYRIILTFRLE